MRRVIAAFLLLIACSRGDAVRPVNDFAVEPPPSRPITDLHFNDEQLQAIAETLVRQAQRRGVRESAGATRADRLIALEAALGAPPMALRRVDRLAAELTYTDASQWAALRRAADREFRGRDDAIAKRMTAMLDGWQRQRLASAMSYMSSNYADRYIKSIEWERRFADFLAAHPADAAAWGWLVAREYKADVAAQYERADAEQGYRFYLELSGLGTHRDARRAFSVPGVAIGAP